MIPSTSPDICYIEIKNVILSGPHIANIVKRNVVTQITCTQVQLKLQVTMPIQEQINIRQREMLFCCFDLKTSICESTHGFQALFHEFDLVNCGHGKFSFLLKQDICTLQEKVKAELKCQTESM